MEDSEPTPTAIVASRVRDNFSASTKRLLAERVGYLCSNPACRMHTIGPRQGENGIVITGVAAHISAASGPRGPRFDESLTSEERSSYDNGIWLCANHAHQIDHDVQHFTVDMLREWKADAEAFAGKLITGTFGLTGRSVPMPRSAWAEVGAGEDVEYAAYKETARVAAIEHLRTFKQSDEWPVHAVHLGLASSSLSDGQEFTVHQLAGVVPLSREIKLVAPPGTGKTTTMVQLGDSLAAGGVVPLLIPLPEWAGSSKGLLEWAVEIHAFRTVSVSGLQRLLAEGDLVLLLDGLNELPGEARTRLITQLNTLRRTFRLLMLVISTRRQAQDIPFGAATVEIQDLSEKQQEEIAEALNGDAGLTMLDHAWRTPGLRDLTGIPLYLSALLRLAPDGQLPETKDEVIAALVRNHESNWSRSDAIEQILGGHHGLLLREIAVAATRTGSTSIGQGEAMKVIATVAQSLQQIAALPQPKLVLDTLVNIHALRRDEDGKVRFRHHQLQEWYASQAVETMLLEHTFPNLLISDNFSKEIVNTRAWEEALLFACERLSRAGRNELAAVAKVVRVALGVDPNLAAATIRRSSEALWDIVAERVMQFAQAWHESGKPDLALAFMVATGRPEFASVVWPLITQADPQDQLEALRMAGRFVPKALDVQMNAEYAILPEAARSRLLGEFVYAGGMDGIEGAVLWACRDPSSNVKIEVIESLLFRRATRHASKILAEAADEVWAAIGKKGYADLFDAADQVVRLRDEHAQAIDSEPSLYRKLVLLLEGGQQDFDGAKILSVLESPVLDIKADGFVRTLSRLHNRAPELLMKGFVSRISQGLNLPYGWENFLDDIEVQDSSSVASAAFGATDTEFGMAAAAVVGPVTVRRMIDYWLELGRALRALGRPATKEQLEIHHLKSDIIKATKPTVFLRVLLQFADETNPETIAALSELLHNHRVDDDRSTMAVDKALHMSIVGLLARWGKVLAATSDVDRCDLHDLAKAMQRFPDTTLLPVIAQLLNADLERWDEEIAKERIEARRRGASIARTSYTSTYRELLRVIGGTGAKEILMAHLDSALFGVDAACGLALLDTRATASAQGNNPFFRHWIDYGRATVARRERMKEQDRSAPEAEAILAEAERHLLPETLNPSRAAALASWGFMLPHGNKSDLIQKLLTQPLTSRSRFNVLTRLFLGGHQLTDTMLIDGLNLFFSEHKRDMWSVEREPWELLRWIELFPHSTRPESLFDALDLIRRHFRSDLKGRNDGLLISIRYMETVGGLDLLRELGRRLPQFLGDHVWYQSLMAFPPLHVLDAVVEMAEDPGSGWTPSKAAHSFPADLGYALSGVRDGTAALGRAFSKVKASRTKAFLARVMLETGEVPMFLKAIEDPVGQDAALRQIDIVLQKMAFRREPPGHGNVIYTHIPVDASSLRMKLFQLANSDDSRNAEFGKLCLIKLEELRVDYGRVDTEPRHPDISLGVPWPNLQ